jgi:hypothetical protein
MSPQRFPFAFQRPYDLVLRVVGATPDRSAVLVHDDHLDVRFGRLRIRTPWDNVVEAHVAGPYRAYRAIGPRLSLADRGVTFGSTAAGGVCIHFARPVAALFGRRKVHPNLTVTVADPPGLVAAIERARTGTS